MSEKKNYFAFYETFEEQLSGLPEETQARFYLAIVKYGLHGKDTEFDNPLEAALFKQFKFAIDNQKAKSKTNSDNRKNEKKGNETKKKETEGKKTNENEKKGNADEEEIEIEVEYEKEGEEERETAAEAPVSAPSLSESQQIFAENVFDLWKNAGLPCCNGNFITFLQKDFKDSLQYVREIHSDDVIQAINNFVSVLEDPYSDDFWWKQHPTFTGFCSGKLLGRFLPCNFHAEDYKRKLSADELKKQHFERDKAERDAKRAEFNASTPKVCEKCGEKLVFNEIYGMAECHNCGSWYEKHGEVWTFCECGG